MAVILLNIMSASTTFENLLSIGMLQWLVILIGCKIKGKNELKVKMS